MEGCSVLSGGVVSFSWMWGHQHLDWLSGDGRPELDYVSPCAIFAVAVMWCVCVVVGDLVGDAGPWSLLLARDLLLGEFVPSWCGRGFRCGRGAWWCLPCCACGWGLG
ncbi:hypothetical protein AMECASPLE_009384 [Ameca splendens]|uniref:Uncharacterized protein n=1 Tax=Ameca splendens TaxID=208324 RepID=A0ABV0Y0M2_9TELE